MAQQLCNTNEDKQLTTKDLGRITYASFMNFFHTNTQFSPCPFGVRPKAHWVYVKRVNSNSYSYQSFNTFAMAQNLSSALTMERLLTSQTTKDAATIAKLSPDLICDKDGDERVLIWCYYHAFSGFENSKSKLGFYIIPIHITSYTNLDAIVSSTVINPLQFQYKLVFTPKPGLFPIKQ
ncbi:MAG: hypothetical protein IJT36_04315 [Alphaproteobacteria bacterium]|nr:hypothetical protein [Alphaproteobacteria bacterium]